MYSMLPISRRRVGNMKIHTLFFKLVTVVASREENGVLGTGEGKEADFSLYTLLYHLNFVQSSLV